MYTCQCGLVCLPSLRIDGLVGGSFNLRHGFRIFEAGMQKQFNESSPIVVVISRGCQVTVYHLPRLFPVKRIRVALF